MRRQFLSQMLVTAMKTSYNEQGKQLCDEDTRIDILSDIRMWVYDTSSKSQNFLWLTGDPGSGKSTIAASIARECERTGILWAQFFISRNNADTTEPKSYFPTIARQLCNHIPDSDVTLEIHDALKEDPFLMDDISADQASKLFIDALEVASKLDPERPIVVVIDGLDETSRPRLRIAADIFSKLFAKLRCRNAKVFISSRTEDDIQKPFSKAFDVKHVKHIHLDTSDDSSIRDVSIFLRRRIGEIVENNDLNWEEWPGKARMQLLCARASGLFIWAATVVKFFQEQIGTMGMECLNYLLDAFTAEGMGDINALYGAALQLVYKDQTNSWAFETFRRIVGCIAVLHEPLCLAEIDDLLDLRQDASRARVDIQHFVRRLRTVLVVGSDSIDSRTIPRLHKSFFEFITSEHADIRFRVDPTVSNGELAMRCLHQLAGLRAKRVSTNSLAKVVEPLPAGLGYALQFGFLHFPEATRTMSGIAIMNSTLQLPELQKLLLLPANDLSCSRHVGVAFPPNKKHIAISWNSTIWLWDMTNGQPINRSIQHHPGLVLSVAFSPDGKRVVSGCSDHKARVWDSQSGQPIGPPSLDHTDWVQSVAYSPDGKQIVSGSNDCKVRIWDSQSGELIRLPFRGHRNHVWSVAFSPDGKLIASGSEDRTVGIWDSKSGEPVQPRLKGHTGGVYSVSFSLDGKRIVSGGGDHTVRIWDLQSRQSIRTSHRGHTGNVTSVAFSPDGKRVVSGGGDRTVRIWDSQSGEAIGLPSKGHTGGVTSVSFSPDGKQVVSGSRDRTVRVWDSRSGEPFGTPFRGHADWVRSVSFSSDGKQIASSSEDQTSRLWDLQSGKPIGPPFQNDTTMVRSVAFSPDAKYIICVSLDDGVQFWDLQTGLPMGLSLQGETKELISIAMSPEGSRIAAASSNGIIYLWDAATHQFVSPPAESSIDGFKSLTFSTDGSRLILAGIDGSNRVWNAKNGEPMDASQSSESFLIGNNEVMSFDMKQGWSSGRFFNAPLLWFPSNNPNAGVWAYIDGKVISNNGRGSATIIDVNDVVPERIRGTSLRL